MPGRLREPINKALRMLNVNPDVSMQDHFRLAEGSPNFSVLQPGSVSGLLVWPSDQSEVQYLAVILQRYRSTDVYRISCPVTDR